MYAVVTRYQVAKPLNEAATQEIDAVAEALMEAPGNRALYGFATSPVEMVAVSIWESQRDAEDALQQAGPSVIAAIGTPLGRRTTALGR